MKMGLFDLCIVGPGMGGLLCALMMQKKGAKVLLLDHEKFHLQDFDLAEDVRGFTVKQSLIQAGFHPQESSFLRYSDLPMQLLLPEGRVNCFAEQAKIRMECEIESRAHPKLDFMFLQSEIFGSEVYKYLFHEKENIVEQNFLDRFRTKRKVQKNIPQQTLRAYRRKTLLRKFRMANADALLRSAALCFYRYDTSWITQSRLSHFLETLREYSFDVDKGVYGLKSEMRKIFVKRGGKYHHFSSIDSCTYQERELSALHLEGAPWTEIQAKKFLISGDPSGLLGTDKDIGKHLFRYRNPHQKKVGRIINFAFCGLRNKLPQTLSNQGIIFPEYPIGNQGKDRRRFIRIIKFRKIEVNPLEEDFFLFDKEADEQSVWLSVSIYVSLEWDEDIEKLKSEVYRQMACVAPFFSPKTFPCIYSTYKELGAIRGDFRDGFIYGNEKPAEFGIKGDSFKTGLKNVFVLNREILPGLGLDGELMAARELIANFL